MQSDLPTRYKTQDTKSYAAYVQAGDALDDRIISQIEVGTVSCVVHDTCLPPERSAHTHLVVL